MHISQSWRSLLGGPPQYGLDCCTSGSILGSPCLTITLLGRHMRISWGYVGFARGVYKGYLGKGQKSSQGPFGAPKPKP